MKLRGQLHLAPMVGVLLLGFALGAHKLNADYLWLDELYSLSNMGVFSHPYSPPEVIDSLREHSPNHVPLYFIIGGGWARFVGWAQLPMRYLSLLFGILLVAWLYRLAADVFDRATAILAALLISTSGFVLLYFHEIRMYTLLLLLAVVHVWLYWRLCASLTAKRREWLLFAVTASALLYTHVFAVFFFAGLGLQHLVFATRIRPWRAILFAWFISALSFLPYAPFYLQGALAERTIGTLQETALSAPEIARDLAHIIVNGVELLWLPLLALAGLALWQHREPRILRLLVIWLGIVLSLILFNEIFPLIDKLRFRFFLVSMPFFSILCARLCVTRSSARIASTFVFLVWIAGGLSIYGLGDSWTYSGRNALFVDIPPLHRIADALRDRAGELDTVVGFSRSKFVDWPLRHGKSIADYYFGALLKLDHAFVLAQDSQADLPVVLDERLDDHPYLILAYHHADLPALVEQAVAAINSNYTSCDVLVDREDLWAQRFVDRSLACDRPYQPIHYEIGIKLIDRFGDYDRDSESVRAVTGWAVADQSQLDEYNVSIQLHTADGQNLRQAGDRHLHDDILKWYVEEMSTTGLPPGDYQVVVILYDRITGGKVGGHDPSSGEFAAILPVFAFAIEA